MRVALVILALALPFGFGSAAAQAKPHCAEDQPCWTWSKMGNQRRGVVLRTPHGERQRRAILDPCEFAIFARHGWINWRRTPHLRGDRWAMRHGCERSPLPIVPLNA